MDRFERIARRLGAARYEVDDVQAREELQRVLGRSGYVRWNNVGTWLVDFYYKRSRMFSNKVCMAAHQVGSLMVNLKMDGLEKLFEAVVQSEDVVSGAGMSATNLFALDYVEGTMYGALKETLADAKDLVATMMAR